MNREELMGYIAETYGTEAEYPWMPGSNHVVFRHQDNRKWFALVMNVPREKLGLSDGGALDLLNVKCEPVMIGSLLGKEGFFPAYHMNKTNWISAALDGSVEDELLKILLDVSFQMTRRRKRDGLGTGTGKI